MALIASMSRNLNCTLPRWSLQMAVYTIEIAEITDAQWDIHLYAVTRDRKTFWVLKPQYMAWKQLLQLQCVPSFFVVAA